MELRIYKQAVGDYFKNEPVVVVYLFGSAARGEETERSDIDVGILFERNLSADQKSGLKVKYMADLPKIFSNQRVEVVDVETAVLPLQYKIIAPRGELYVRDKKGMVDFERKVVGPYLDFQTDYNKVVNYQLKTMAREGFANAQGQN